MTILLNQVTTDPYAKTYWQNLETALMARTIEATADLPPERRKALLSVWLQGVFDAAAVGLPQQFNQDGLLVWTEHGSLRHLTYHAPTGFSCHLGRVYPQPNGTWAALVIAGVADDEHTAMAKAEWAISRLTA